MVVGLDIGYGYTKMAASNGISFMYKTAVSKFVPEKVWGNSVDYVSVGSEKYVVGDAATELMSGNFSVSDDFVGTNEYYAIIAKSLEMLNKMEIKLLVLGLPPGLYTEQRTKELSEKIKSISMFDRNGNIIVVPQEIVYIPQGSGIYFSHVLGGSNGDFNLSVAVIDIGYYTLDAVCFAKGRFISGAAKSYPAGSKFLIERIKESFHRKYGIFISDSSCELLLKNGKILHFGREFSLNTKEIVHQYYHDQVLRAIKDYAASLRQHGTMVDKVIMGGGSIVWAPDIKGVTIVSNPQMANAIGYMKYGETILKKA